MMSILKKVRSNRRRTALCLCAILTFLVVARFVVHTPINESPRFARFPIRDQNPSPPWGVSSAIPFDRPSWLLPFVQSCKDSARCRTTASQAYTDDMLKPEFNEVVAGRAAPKGSMLEHCASEYDFACQDWEAIVSAQNCSTAPSFVARVPWPQSKTEWEVFERAGKPVVFTGLHENVVKSPWTYKKLRERIGNEILTYRYGEYSKQGSAVPEHTRAEKSIKVSAFLDKLEGRVPEEPGNPIYLANNHISSKVQEQLDVPTPAYATYANGATLWFGKRGSTSPLHKDSMDNFIVQLMGRKRIVLFPPTSWKAGASSWH